MTREEKQKAIDAVERLNALKQFIGYDKDSEIVKATQKSLDMAIKALEQEPKWIPVSERLPEEKEWIGTKRFGTTISDEVYVTMETPSGHRFCEHIRFQNGNLSIAKQAEMDALFKGTKPIAWMPLPEPYKAESEGE